MPISTIAIVGASRPIGARLLSLLDQDERVLRVVGIDDAPPPLHSDKLEFIQRPLDRSYNALFADHGVQAALYLALDDEPRGGPQAQILYFQRFLEACRLASCQTLGLLSTTAAYGAHPDNLEILYEGSQLRPNSHAGTAAAELERLCYEYVRDFPNAHLQILRAALVVGRDSQNILSRALRRRLLFIPQDAELAYQFVHEDDVARALHALIDSQAVGIFNLAADSALTIEQIAMLSERRLIRLPAPILRTLVRIGKSLGLSRTPWVAPDAFDHTRFPLLVANIKFRQEIYFDFLFSSPEAFLESLMEPDADPLGDSFEAAIARSDDLDLAETPSPEDLGDYDPEARAAAFAANPDPAHNAAAEPAHDASKPSAPSEVEATSEPDPTAEDDSEPPAGPTPQRDDEPNSEPERNASPTSALDAPAGSTAQTDDAANRGA